MLLLAGVTPAQAVSTNWGGCNVKVTPVVAGIYMAEKFCRVSSVFDIRTKTSQSLFYISPKRVKV